MGRAMEQGETGFGGGAEETSSWGGEGDMGEQEKGSTHRFPIILLLLVHPLGYGPLGLIVLLGHGLPSGGVVDVGCLLPGLLVFSFHQFHH